MPAIEPCRSIELCSLGFNNVASASRRPLSPKDRTRFYGRRLLPFHIILVAGNFVNREMCE